MVCIIKPFMEWLLLCPFGQTLMITHQSNCLIEPFNIWSRHVPCQFASQFWGDSNIISDAIRSEIPLSCKRLLTYVLVTLQHEISEPLIISKSQNGELLSYRTKMEAEVIGLEADLELSKSFGRKLEEQVRKLQVCSTAV